MKKLTLHQRVGIKVYEYELDAKGKHKKVIVLAPKHFGKVVSVNPDGLSGYVLPDTTPENVRGALEPIYFHVSELEEE